MNSKLCDDVERSIWRYIDRELSARDVARISVHLKDCRSCNRLFEARSRENSVYRLAYVESPFGDDFADRFRESFSVRLASAEVGAMDSSSDIFSFDPPARHRRLAVVISVAAILTIAVVGVLLRTTESPTEPSAPGDARLAENREDDGDKDGKGEARGEPRAADDSPLPVAASPQLGFFMERSETRVARVDRGVHEPLDGNEVRPGAIYQFRPDAARSTDAERVELALLSGSRLVFASIPWTFEVLPASSPREGIFEGFLQEGELEASVVLRPRDGRQETFAIRTPNARLKVVGTRFLLRVAGVSGAYTTALRVIEGEVEVQDLRSRGTRLLGPREDEYIIPAPIPERARPSPSAPNLDRPFQIRESTRDG